MDKKLKSRPSVVRTNVRMYTLKASGVYLSMSYWYVRELVLSGSLPHIKAGKKFLIDRQDLDRWIEERKEVA